MNPRLLLCAVFCSLLLAAAPMLRAAAPAKPVLGKGMAAAEIVRLIGRPDEIKPMKAEGVTAEQWIYRCKVDQTVYQTANTQSTIPALTGIDGGGVVIGTAIVPSYRLKYAEQFQVTALLLIDGKLHLGRQWFEQTESFAD
ncbi:MAG: hypothetical protein PSV13_19330 [Lacunisphaera sp.]|nr:hypothetical protein [Lacunisphaera sp.]